MNIVVTGHVDHGKSTVIGRLLADTNSLPTGKLEQVRENCRKNSKPFEYAFLLDALKDEQAQGITIDSARCFFKTDKRRYTIIDAPGHIEFLKNMVSGAARASAALLVIDAEEGICENSKRHGYLLSMLGIKQIVVLINKMDRVGYSKSVYDETCKDYSAFLDKAGIIPRAFIPVSGVFGDNIANVSSNTGWYSGNTVLLELDGFDEEEPPDDEPFRMFVQDVYKFTKNGDDRRIVAGTLETGKVSTRDDIIFYPSGKKSRIKTIEEFGAAAPQTIYSGKATGFTLNEQIYIKRGELVAKEGQPQPKTAKRLLVNLFWLGREPFLPGKSYVIKIGRAKAVVYLEKVEKIVDAVLLKAGENESVKRNEAAKCVISLDKPLAFDTSDVNFLTSRFVIVDGYDIAGGGTIEKGLLDEESLLREKIITRNIKWEKSWISAEERTEKYKQRAGLVLITGHKDAGKKPVAKALEKRFFDQGRFVYFIGIANVLYGVDADIKGQNGNNKEEHFRRLGEIAYLMLDAGCILIVTARDVNEAELDILREAVGSERITTAWIGNRDSQDLLCDIHIESFNDENEACLVLGTVLQYN